MMMIEKILFWEVLLVSIVFLSIVCKGDVGITSAFVRAEWPTIDIPLDNGAFVVPKGHNAPQQVHCIGFTVNFTSGVNFNVAGASPSAGVLSSYIESSTMPFVYAISPSPSP